MRVTLYERKDCGLCEEAYEALRRLRIEVLRVDVDGDAALGERYTLRVPVLRRAGEELDAAGLDEGAIARWLAAPSTQA